MKPLVSFALFLSVATLCMAQQTTKKGYNIGFLPAVSYNTDDGFQYGVIANLFNYGKGENYPKYDQSYYLEFSKYTKGSTVLRFYLDSEHFIEGLRTFADLSYIAEDQLDFYGFNGTKSRFSTSEQDNNRAFYKMSQKQLRMLLDVKGSLGTDHLYWVGSYNLVNYKNSAVNYDKLNKNENFSDITPGFSVYEKYVSWGLIDPKEANGGLVSSVKGGIVYDSRPVLNNPDRGIYTEALLEWAPGFMNERPYTRYSILHEQFIGIVDNALNLAYRVGVQGKLGSNTVPFYRNPVLMSPFANRMSPTGLGGSTSIRGMLRNRVVGDAFAMGNFELRWKAIQFQFIHQNFYLGFNGFCDVGYILDPIDWDLTNISAQDQSTYFKLNESEKLHKTLGGGLKIAMNENFILSCEWGKALQKDDGDTGLYIDLNYLF